MIIPYKVYFAVAALLLLALADMPYGYYTFLRLVVTVFAGCLAYNAFKANDKNYAWLFGAVALLFNPIIKVPLDRDIWAIIDLGLGIYFGYIGWKEKKSQKTIHSSITNERQE